MRFAAGVLAVMIVAAGLAGPTIEHALHASFETSVADGLVSTDVEPESSSHSTVPILSLCLLAIGALPAYYLYFARKASPKTLMESYPWVRALYTFFWKRWYIDGFYDRVFVDGTMRLSSLVADLEDSLDRFVNRRLPVLIKQRALSVVIRLRTETEELLYNVSYVLVIFVLFLIFLFLGIRVA
jgi:NADH:ubiquinone oxidoreductase subunit 5 (subunit L)/multisubunit Na+/H+ antiporter MnhA subunit